jgi:hypothetical protein
LLRNDAPLFNPISAAWNTVARFDDYAAAFGVLGGALFGFAAHAATRGQRDFSSVRVLSAGRYDLIARGGSADQARTMLAELGLAPTA